MSASGENRGDTLRRATERRRRDYRATVVKLLAFCTVMLLVFGGLVMVFSGYRAGDVLTYTATFADASQLKADSKVRVAGVEVGRVKKVELNRDNHARVRFTVDSSIRLPVGALVKVRYENLTGDRYVEVDKGTGDATRLLPPGASIPISHTEPALDLDTLIGGFKPLLRTLNPDQVNELSASLVQIFQGQGPALNQLLTQTAQFTKTLADRDVLIGQVIANLNKAMAVFADDSKNLDTSLNLLQQLVSGLASQREVIGDSIDSAARATNGLADLLSTNRPNLAATITETGQVSDQILPADTYIRGLIRRLPGDLTQLSGLGSYGAWLQLYLCRVTLYFSGPDGKEIAWTTVDSTGDNQKAGGRCQPREVGAR